MSVLKRASILDLLKIRTFTDFWLAGRGLAKGAPGAVNDYFISPSQHRKYIQKYRTYVLIQDNKIFVWTVIQPNGSLIHLLVHGEHRGQGLGTKVLDLLQPKSIHSKSNQSSGDPGQFYESHGYKKVRSVKSESRFDIDKIRPDREKIIDIYQRIT